MIKEVSNRPINLAIGITAASTLLFGIGLYIMNTANSSAMVPGVIAACASLVLGLVGLGRHNFAGRQEREELAAEQYRRQHGKTELFDDADEAVRLAARANQQFVKYFVPVLTVLAGLFLLLFSLAQWLYWNRQDAFPVAPKPLPMAILSVVCCIGTLIIGSFFIGASRDKSCRWLRPSGAWMFLAGFLYLLAGGALFLEYFQKATLSADIMAGRIGMAVIGILGIEMLLSFVIEFYRPRMPGEAERPLPESRLLALFTEPGGVARNVAASLDYQFGFQVSEAWFYRFLERTVAPLFVLMFLAFWLQTCLVVVETEHNGIREMFGRVVSATPLPPGLYLKLPTPFERIYRFPVEHVQEIIIGGHEAQNHNGEPEYKDDGHGHAPPPKRDKQEVARVIVWDLKEVHAHEADFIVADEPEEGSKDSSLANQLNLGLVSAHIPLYFKVLNLYDYAYRHQDPGKTLKNLAIRELVRYMAGANFNGILGHERQKASEILKENIQAACNEVQLGIEVVFVGLAGLHPPGGVGGAFDAVVGARETQQQQVLHAEAYAAMMAPAALSQAVTLKNQAESYRQEREQVSAAEGERFLSQLKGFHASPELFVLSSYLDVMANEGRRARKYIVTGQHAKEVIILNLEKKMRSSLLDLNLSPEAPAAQ